MTPDAAPLGEVVQRASAMAAVFYRLTKAGYNGDHGHRQRYFPAARKAAPPVIPFVKIDHATTSVFVRFNRKGQPQTVAEVEIPAEGPPLPRLDSTVKIYAITPEGPRFRQAYRVADMADFASARLRPVSVVRKGQEILHAAV